MKYPDNTAAIAALQPDYMGFIFYKGSKRYCGDTLTPEFVRSLPDSIIKTGVFVNESIQEVLRIAKAYGLQALQLHGGEDAEYCRIIRNSSLKVIKVFHMDEQFDWSSIELFKPVSDFFLFDTKTNEYGGSGKRFNWKLLKEYDQELPMFLSGGLDEGILNELNQFESVPIYALDINSCFETEPGRKEIERVKTFLHTFRKQSK